MAEMTAPAPYEAAKPHHLHDQTKLPAAPTDQGPWREYAGLIAVGIAVGVGLTALGVEIRDGWESHRDWVVPVIAQFSGIAGVAAAHLAWRRAAGPLGLTTMLVTACLVLTGSYIWVEEARADPYPAVDVLRIVAGVVFGLAVANLILASVVTEWRDRTRGPAREAPM